MLATAGFDQIVNLWNPNTLRFLGELKGHSGPIVALASDERAMSKYIVSLSMDESIRIWDIRSQKCE